LGFVPAELPPKADILFLGEAPGEDEAYASKPFVGRSGARLDRLLTRVGLKRGEVGIGNVLACEPESNRMDRAHIPAAIAHCAVHREPWLRDPRWKLIVPLGGSALRVLHGFEHEKVQVKDFHGQPLLDPQDRWSVATFHPAFLLRKPSLTGIVYWDLQRALKVMKEGWEYDQPRLVIDPPLEWLDAWLDQYEVVQETVWLFADTETKGKGTDEGMAKSGVTKREKEQAAKLQHIGSAILNRSNPSAQIIRVNLAMSVNEGITFPFEGPYIERWRRAMAMQGVKVFWNAEFDTERSALWDCPVSEPILDAMNAWHVLQSDVPKGLGFVSPIYSKAAPWKHLVNVDPGLYAAMDPVQTARIGYGVARDLQAIGMWEVFRRHLWQLDVLCLRPAKKIGLGFDREDLLKFQGELELSMEQLSDQMQALYPEALQRLEPKHGLKDRPEGQEVVEKLSKVPVLRCTTCGQEERVGPSHKCKDKTLVPKVEQVERELVRFFRRVPFNPESSQQVLSYVLHQGHEPGTNKAKTQSVDKLALARLQNTQDPFYTQLTKYRQTTKMSSAFVESTLARLDQNNRVHASTQHNPSTLRLNMADPNLQQVAAGRDGREVGKDLAKRYRRTVRAAKGCVFLELDFSAIEAVLVGWFAKDPGYIRAARLGVHAYLASVWLKKPPPEHWTDEEKGAYYKTIKADNPTAYDRSKRVVHMSAYLATPFGIVRNYPEHFASTKDAAHLQSLLFKLAPKMRRWQLDTVEQAHAYGGLGGTLLDKQLRTPKDGLIQPPPVHPFGYKHTFWEVKEARRAADGSWQFREGDDAKRAVAFYPQSTARGVLTEACLRLFDPEHPSYIGYTFFGETPLRALIHDSVFLEVEEQHADWVLQVAWEEMVRPVPELPCPEEWGMGTALSIGVEAKRGINWADMEIVPPCPPGVAWDTAVEEEDDESEPYEAI
jgi:uracil-DNA glycosylase family 4